MLERIKDPLQTMVARDHYETAWAALTHFHLIAQRAPVLFSQVLALHPRALACCFHRVSSLGLERRPDHDSLELHACSMA